MQTFPYPFLRPQSGHLRKSHKVSKERKGERERESEREREGDKIGSSRQADKHKHTDP